MTYDSPLLLCLIKTGWVLQTTVSPSEHHASHSNGRDIAIRQGIYSFVYNLFKSKNVDIKLF